MLKIIEICETKIADWWLWSNSKHSTNLTDLFPLKMIRDIWSYNNGKFWKREKHETKCKN